MPFTVGEGAENEENNDSGVTETPMVNGAETNAKPRNSLPGLLKRKTQRGKPSQSPSRSTSGNITNARRVSRVSSKVVNLGLMRSKLYNSFPNLARKDSRVANRDDDGDEDDNVQRVLKAVASDHVVSTNAEDNRNRRTVFVERSADTGKFGFTIQSYAFRRSVAGDAERITYVDYVDLNGPAFYAGLRPGDTILAINGSDVQRAAHNQLVDCIRRSSSLRMVVLFENCVNRIELCTRAIKLQKLLADKEFELRALSCQEDRIVSGIPPLTDVQVLASLRTPCHSPRITRCSSSDHVAFVHVLRVDDPAPPIARF